MYRKTISPAVNGLVIPCLLGLGSFALAASARGGEPQTYDAVVRPFLQKHCIACHGSVKQNGKLRLDGPAPDFGKTEDIKKWDNVRKQLASGAMPPEGRPEPRAEELEGMLDWVGAELQRALIASRGGAGRRPLRRLNREEYGNTLQDLLGLRFANFDLKLGDRLPPDGIGASFKNDAEALTIQPLHFQRFLETAEHALNAVIVAEEKPPTFKYQVDLAQMKSLAPKSGMPLRQWETDAYDPATKTTLKAKAILVEPIPGKGIELGPVFSKENLEGPDGIRLMLTLPIVAPSSGVIRVQIRAHAILVEGESEPVLRLLLHYRDNNYVNIPLGSAAVAHTQDQPGDYVFEIPIDFVEGTWDVVRRQKQVQLMLLNDAAPIGDRAAEQKPKKGEKWPWPEPKIVLHSIQVETPYFASWPPPAQRALLDVPGDVQGESARARIVLKRFMDRAYRRPATATEVDRMIALFHASRKKQPDFASAIKAPLAAILCSPNFLCIIERKAEKPGPLSDHELATRLSYFLWNTTPDDELLRLADAKQLSDPKTLIVQIDRLLKSPRSDAFCRSFVSQWLGLERIAEVQTPFCELSKSLGKHVWEGRNRLIKENLAEEPVQFFRHALANDLPPRTLIDADFMIVNDRLAEYYGMKSLRGSAFRPIKGIPVDRSGGLLTQAGVIAAATEGNEQAVVKRGVYAMTHLLDLEVGTPPANVVTLTQQAKEDAKFAKLSVRDQLKKHTQVQSCAVCHNRIDPLGYFWGGYDATGRTGFASKKSAAIKDTDTGGRLPDKTSFRDFAEFRAILADRNRSKHSFASSFTRKLLAYALGRSLDFGDQPQINRFVDRIEQQKLGLRGAVHEVVLSEAFLTK